MARPRKQVDLPATFRGPRVLTLDQLVKRLSLSRSSVLRRLSEHGYFASYNHRRRFLTIEEVADFDSHGLWMWNAARFSTHGALKDTAEHFIVTAERGMTHEELSELLVVRVHNALLELVEENRTVRERLGPAFVYLSPKSRVRREQIRRRMAFLKEREKPRPTSRQIIVVLVELIKDPKASMQDLVARARRAGVSVTHDLVDAIFESYDLDKKRAL